MNKEQELKVMKFQVKRFEESINTPEALKFLDATDADGKKYTIDAETLTIGANVFLVDAEGNKTPLEDGKYTMIVDSKSFDVTVEKGFIVDFSEVVADAETAPKEDSKPVEAKTVEASKESKESNEDYKALKNEFDSLKKEFTEFRKVLKTITSLASAKPIESTSKTTQKIVVSEDEKFEAIAKVLREAKANK